MTVSTYEPHTVTQADAALARWVRVLEPAAMLAERIVGTEFVPASIRDNAPAILACIMYGDEIGIGPMQSLAGIHVIDGRPAPSSELLRAMVFAAGHSIRVVSLSGTSCTIAGKRRGESEWTQIVWTEQMARTAGLFNKAVWSRYPRAMLLARASSELARILFPDVVKGLSHLTDDEATADEFQDWATTIPEEQAPPERRTVERRRRPPVADSDAAARPAGAEHAPIAAPAGHLAPPEAIPDAPPPAVRRMRDTPLPDMVPPPVADPDTNTTDGGGGPLPDSDDAKPDVPVDQRQIRAIMAGFNEINCDNRALRLQITRAAIHRNVDTSLQLTRREALTLIRVLSDLKQGLLTLVIDPDGSVEIAAREEDSE